MVVVAFRAVKLRFHEVSGPSSNVWYLRVVYAKVLLNGCENCRYVVWSSSIVGIAKEMYSVSVSRSKVLRLLVVDLHWKYGV